MAFTINDARRIVGDANLSDDELIAIARKAGFEFDPVEPTNTEVIGALLNNPSVLIGKFIAEPLAGVVLAYGIVWLIMRPKKGSKIDNSFLWHSYGVAATILGSAIFRIMAMVTFAGRSAYEPVAEGGGAGFYMFIVPALVAAGYIAWLKKNKLDLSDPTPDLFDLKHQIYLASKIASLFDGFIIQSGTNSFLSSTTAVALSKDADVFLSQSPREKLIGPQLFGYVKISQLKSYYDVREMMLNEPESGLLTVYIDNLAQEALRELISQAKST